MKRQQFLRLLKQYCRKTNLSFSKDLTSGKGSHARVTVNGKTTTVKAGELTPAYVALLLK